MPCTGDLGKAALLEVWLKQQLNPPFRLFEINQMRIEFDFVAIVLGNDLAH